MYTTFMVMTTCCQQTMGNAVKKSQRKNSNKKGDKKKNTKGKSSKKLNAKKNSKDSKKSIEKKKDRANGVNKSTGLKKLKIQFPASTENVLIFKIIRDGDHRSFCTKDFTDEWVENKITKKEVKKVLNRLRLVEGFNVHLVLKNKKHSKSEKMKLLAKREKNFNKYLISHDSQFRSRGFQFRTGRYGAWIQLEKVDPALTQPEIIGFTPAMNPFAGVQQQPKEHAKQVVGGGVSSNPNYDYGFDDSDFEYIDDDISQPF